VGKENLFLQVAKIVSNNMGIPISKITCDTLINGHWEAIKKDVTKVTGRHLQVGCNPKGMTVGKLLAAINKPDFYAI